MVDKEDNDELIVESPEADKSAAKETDLQVEVIDDTPPEDKNRPKRTGEPDLPDEDEVAQYGEKVKKRITKLKYEFHEERRAKEELERQQKALADYAKRIISENSALKKALQSGQSIIADQMQSRVETELEFTKRKLKEAVETGDIDKQIEAQQNLARLSVEADKVRTFRPTQVEEQEQEAEERYVPQVAPPQPDEKTLAWARKNTWFGRDQKMTDFARHMHDRLVVFDGVDPKTDEYWSKLDAALQERFPHLAPDVEDEDNRPPQKKQPVVAPVKRSTTPPRKIQLSASEVAIAKRLGLTVEQYAAEKLRSM